MSDAPKPRRMTRIILILSLVLNVALIGLIVGAVGSGRAGPPMRFEAGIGPLGQILPREDRAKIGRDIRRMLQEKGRNPREQAAALREVVGLLEAETFDDSAFISTIEAQQNWQDQVREAALDSFVAHVSSMTLTERRDLATALRARLSRRSGPDGGRG